MLTKKIAGSEFLESKGKMNLYLVSYISQRKTGRFKSHDKYSIKWIRDKTVFQNQ